MATNFDKHYYRQFNSLKLFITQKTTELFNIYNIVLTTTNITKKFWKEIEKRIDFIYKEMDLAFKEWSALQIPSVYKKELLFMDRKIKSTKYIVNTSMVNVTDLINSRASNGLTTALVADSISSMRSSLFAGGKDFKRFTRMTQQQLIAEHFVDEAVIFGIQEKNVRIGKSQLYQTLKKQLGEKKFVQAGKYKYKPSYYAEMVTRTKFHETQSYAAVMTAGNYGTDLVRISNHNTKTEICQQYEAQVFSISGKNPMFPALGEVPPYHPNCLHLMFPEFQEAYTKEQLQQMSEFSLGKTDRPPFPAGFVPFNQRESA